MLANYPIVPHAFVHDRSAPIAWSPNTINDQPCVITKQ
jgi:hypothetical protein